MRSRQRNLAKLEAARSPSAAFQRHFPPCGRGEYCHAASRRFSRPMQLLVGRAAFTRPPICSSGTAHLFINLFQLTLSTGIPELQRVKDISWLRECMLIQGCSSATRRRAPPPTLPTGSLSRSIRAHHPAQQRRAHSGPRLDGAPNSGLVGTLWSPCRPHGHWVGTGRTVTHRARRARHVERDHTPHTPLAWSRRSEFYGRARSACLSL